MFLKKFLKPKWQHSNPRIRQEALAELSDDQDPLLVHFALKDTDAGLRGSAVKRLADLMLLQQISRDDKDEAVRGQARERLRRLVAGVDAGIDEQERRAYVSRLDDPGTLEFVARQGCDAALRRTAVARVRRETVLCEVAIKDAAAEVRHEAAQRILGDAALERVYQAVRNRDKRVSRMVRERLAARKDEQERPLRVRAKRESLCAQAEALTTARNLEGAQRAVERLQRQWRQLQAEAPPEEALEARFNAARAGVVQALDDLEKVLEEQPVQTLEASSEGLQKEDVCRALEGMQADLKARNSLGVEDEGTVRSNLQEIEASWGRAEASAGQEEADGPLNQRYREAREAVNERLETLVRQRHWIESSRALFEQMDKADGTDQPLDEKTIAGFERRWHKLGVADTLARGWGLDKHYEKALAGVRERFEALHKRQERDADQLDKVLEDLSAALEQGESKVARSLSDKARNLLGGLRGFQPARVKAQEQRLRGGISRVREMQDWERWGNTKDRELLCEQVEALIGSELDAEEIASRVRTARDTWNKLGASDRESIGSLRERFNQACAKAFEPCKEYYAQQALKRKANLADRSALCQRLENFINDNDWEQMDTKLMERVLREARQAWKQLGEVDHKDLKPISKRFWDGMRIVEGHLKGERQANLEQKRKLLVQAEALLEMEDLPRAIDETKRIQRLWKTVGPGPRRQEQELWTRFRAVCDQVFERRDAQNKERDSERHANLERKQNLCGQLEALAVAAEENTPAQLDGETRRIRQEWDTIGDVPRHKVNALEKRLDRSLEALEGVRERRVIAEQRRQLDALGRKAGVCAALESLAGAGEAMAERVQGLEQAWQDLPDVGGSRAQKALQQRFRRALEWAAAAEPPADLGRLQAANEDAASTLCIRMEILVGVESPPEAADARLKYQVARLSEGMVQSAEEDQDAHGLDQAKAIEMEWWALGPLADREQWNRRFQHARDSFYDDLMGPMPAPEREENAPEQGIPEEQTSAASPARPEEETADQEAVVQVPEPHGLEEQEPASQEPEPEPQGPEEQGPIQQAREHADQRQPEQSQEEPEQADRPSTNPPS